MKRIFSFLLLISIKSYSQVVITYAGTGVANLTNGPSSSTCFHQPNDVVMDNLGNLFVSDYANSCIRKISATGIVSTFAGSGTIGFADGTGAAASFNYPAGMVIDNNNTLYVADCHNHAIRKITANGVVTTIAGNDAVGFVNGIGNIATFNYPIDVALDMAGNIYVADWFNNAIRKINNAGNVTTVSGNGINGFTNANSTNATFNKPQGIALDSHGNIFIADTYNYCIRKIDNSGNVTTFSGTGIPGFQDGNATTAQFNNPWGLVFDSNDDLYLTDEYNNAIRKISTTGNVTTIAGTGVIGAVNGSALSATFYHPSGICIDINKNLFIADAFNNLIREYTPINSPTIKIEPNFIDTMLAKDCKSAMVQFTDKSTSTNTTIVSWNWNFGDGNTSTLHNPFHTFTTNGDFLVSLTIKDISSIIQTITQTIHVQLDLVNFATVTGNNFICGNANAQLFATGGKTYSWQPCIYLSSCTDSTPTAKPLITTTYIVTSINDLGCLDMDTITVHVNEGDHSFFIPNSFSPNGDNINDCFLVRSASEFTTFELHIFNRWGQQIFNSTDPLKCWYGDNTIGQEGADVDTYYYY